MFACKGYSKEYSNLTFTQAELNVVEGSSVGRTKGTSLPKTQKSSRKQHICHDLGTTSTLQDSKSHLEVYVDPAEVHLVLVLCASLLVVAVQGRNTVGTAGRGAENDSPCTVLISFC